MNLIVGSVVAGLPLGTLLGVGFGTLALMTLGLAAFVHLGPRLDVAVVFSSVVVLEIFSGNWRNLGIPIGLDRLVLIAALVLLVARRWDARLWNQWRWEPVYLVMAALVAAATVSAFRAHTLATSLGFYALLDRLGVVPFLFFALVPVVFRSARQRNILLIALVAVGAYLGLTAMLEGFGQTQSTFPSYIHNLTLGIHQGRARGPFLDAVADGAALFDCAVAAALAAVVWVGRWVRAFAVLVAVVCILGTIFTLTRSVWIGTIVGALVALAISRRSRRFLLPVAIVGSISVVTLLSAVPGLSHRASVRTNAQRPLWDRLNSNAAALRAVRAHPLSGVGWERFIQVAPQYLRQADGYPLTASHLEVHNVFLSHAAELGLIGFGLFALAFLGGIVVPALRPLTGEMELWRIGLVAVAGQWVVIASLSPHGTAFPNLVLWTWAGIVYAGGGRQPHVEPVRPHLDRTVRFNQPKSEVAR